MKVQNIEERKKNVYNVLHFEKFIIHLKYNQSLEIK